MIKLDSFIQAIHAAISSANDALMNKNLDVLEKFFEAAEESDQFQSTLDEVMTSLNDILGQEGTVGGRPKITRQKLQTMLESLQGLRDSISQKDIPEADLNQAILPDKLQPKMTTIQFPQKTASGMVVMSDVRVPLVTLVPLSMTQISEVKFRTELEIQVEEEELLVSFPNPKSETASGRENQLLGSSRPRSVGSLEITLVPHHGTEGLKKIVEGYEKALRAQLPH